MSAKSFFQFEGSAETFPTRMYHSFSPLRTISTVVDISLPVLVKLNPTCASVNSQKVTDKTHSIPKGKLHQSFRYKV